MALRYCFERDKVITTLRRSASKDLAVIDTDGIDPVKIRAAVNRGVFVYGYLNAGALERGRSYYSEFKHLRLAKYEGWDNEWWVDVTSREWQNHIIDEAKKIKLTGAIGLYFDNCDIFWMAKERRVNLNPDDVYTALEEIILRISSLGMIVMPNGGDDFVRKFVEQNPGILKTVNQEGVLFQDNKKQSKEDTKYYTKYLDWCKKQGMYVRGIEYTKSSTAALRCKAYYALHGWGGLYISKHKNLEGD